jgi:hypothetical protein
MMGGDCEDIIYGSLKVTFGSYKRTKEKKYVTRTSDLK